LEVFDRLEGEGNLLECFNLGSNTCPLQPVCKLSGIFKEAIDAYRKVLEKYTLEDLLVRKEELSFYLV
jgi:Rrf2 family nitric oxide-sensitive transcriptional repressor